MEKVIDLAPDLIVTAAFGQFLPEKILKAPKLGAINVHASLYQNIVAAHLYITQLLKEKRNRRHDYGNGEENGCWRDFIATRNSDYETR